MRAGVLGTLVTIAALTALAGWLLGPAETGRLPRGDFRPRGDDAFLLTGPDAEARRNQLVAAASPRYLDPDPIALSPAPALPVGHPLAVERPACRFLAQAATGTSAKFECVLDTGEIVKVKYGRNAEIHAEAAATRLLAMLGYPADFVTMAPAIRCYGCPRYPFTTMRLLTLAQATGLLMPYGYDNGYTDFEWVAVETRFPAPAIETSAHEGWAWWELRTSAAPRAELDALRLLAVFLGHWDNKADNQRLVCLEPAPAAGSCLRPVLMLHDVGATFGPPKVNLSRWRDLPVWADRSACLVSMRGLPSHGATFPDAHISEAGRQRLAARLGLVTDEHARAIFAGARFGAFHPGTDDERDVGAWAAAFRHRVEQITSGPPCPHTAAGSADPARATH